MDRPVSGGREWRALRAIRIIAAVASVLRVSGAFCPGFAPEPTAVQSAKRGPHHGVHPRGGTATTQAARQATAASFRLFGSSNPSIA